MTLYVEESGAVGAPTIVFLHGAGMSGWMWEAQVHDLREFHCLNIDLPGHGKSNHIPWLSLTDSAERVADMIETRATAERAHIVGLSLGSYVGLYLLADHSDCLDRVVLSGVTAAPLPNLRTATRQMHFMSRLQQYRWFVRLQAKLLQMPPDSVDAFTESMLAMSRETYLRLIDEVLNFHLPPRLEQSVVPTLVVAGGKELKPILDGLIPIAAALPHAQATIAPGLHHAWNGEAPDLFTAMLQAWFTDTPLPDGLECVAAGQKIEITAQEMIPV
jgi:pimeloyl-ACP methyl ester carboxylesterase